MNKPEASETHEGGSSIGSLGQSFERSEGRAYWTINQKVNKWDQLVPVDNLGKILEPFGQELANFSTKAENLGRRRSVVRFRCTTEILDQLIAQNQPIEVAIPLSLIEPKTTDYLVTLARNVHESDTQLPPNIERAHHSEVTPRERVQNLTEHFQLTCQLTISDIPRLLSLWQPFGWTLESTTNFVQNYQTGGSPWFSGIRDRETRELVSACTGESLSFANVQLVEGTEYSTLPGYEGHGLCTAAVIGLHAQILRDTLYQGQPSPLILSEFSLASRSDAVGIRAGMVLPESAFTNQVLSSNVSVLDRLPPNSLNYRELGDQRLHYRDAFRTTFRYWRNFIVGILPLESIQKFYRPEDVQIILDQYEPTYR